MILSPRFCKEAEKDNFYEGLMAVFGMEIDRNVVRNTETRIENFIEKKNHVVKEK